MPLGMEVDLSKGDILLDGDSAPPRKKRNTGPPILAHVLWQHGCVDEDATW